LLQYRDRGARTTAVKKLERGMLDYADLC